MATHVVLLRAIGPATHAKMTMKALEAAARATGLPDTRSLLNTGNLVVRSDLAADRVQAILLGVLAAHGVETKAVTCSEGRIRALPGLCPDPIASGERGAMIGVTFLDRPATDESLAVLRQRAGPGRVERIGPDLWIDYGPSVAASRLTNAFVEKVTGSVATARNWNTVRRLVAAL